MLCNILCNRWLLSVLAVCILSACSGNQAENKTDEAAEDKTAKPSTPSYVVLAEFTTPGDSLSPLRYFAGDQITLNDRCPVRKVTLNPKMGAAYVNGNPIGFC